jgi:CheY-like chemotaxis protein
MRKTCIIAEHDPWDIRLLRMYVERLGLRLLQAFDGEDLLRLARAERPDVIVLDGELPGALRGGEVLRALKTDGVTSAIPVVLLSWFDDRRHDHAPLHAAGWLRKPVTYESFCAALAEAGVVLQASEL